MRPEMCGSSGLANFTDEDRQAIEELRIYLRARKRLDDMTNQEGNPDVGMTNYFVSFIDSTGGYGNAVIPIRGEVNSTQAVNAMQDAMSSYPGGPKRPVILSLTKLGKVGV